MTYKEFFIKQAAETMPTLWKYRFKDNGDFVNAILIEMLFFLSAGGMGLALYILTHLGSV